MKILTTLSMSSVDSDDPAIKLIPCQVTFAADCFTDTAPDSTGLMMTKLVKKIVFIVSPRLALPSPSFLPFLSVSIIFPALPVCRFRSISVVPPLPLPFPTLSSSLPGMGVQKYKLAYASVPSPSSSLSLPSFAAISFTSSYSTLDLSLVPRTSAGGEGVDATSSG